MGVYMILSYMQGGETESENQKEHFQVFFNVKIKYPRGNVTQLDYFTLRWSEKRFFRSCFYDYDSD